MFYKILSSFNFFFLFFTPSSQFSEDSFEKFRYKIFTLSLIGNYVMFILHWLFIRINIPHFSIYKTFSEDKLVLKITLIRIKSNNLQHKRPKIPFYNFSTPECCFSCRFTHHTYFVFFIGFNCQPFDTCLSCLKNTPYIIFKKNYFYFSCRHDNFFINNKCLDCCAFFLLLDKKLIKSIYSIHE